MVLMVGLMDEIHQWKNGKALFDIIADGVSARATSYLYASAGVIDLCHDENVNGSSTHYKDDHFCHELDNRKEWMDPNAKIRSQKTLLQRLKNKTQSSC